MTLSLLSKLQAMGGAMDQSNITVQSELGFRRVSNLIKYLLSRFLLAITAASLVSCSDRPLTGLGVTGQNHSAVQDYPTTIPRLSADSLATLNTLFSQANPRFCSDLNQFGFTSGSCFTGTSLIGEDASFDSLIEMARNSLAQNSQFTGVIDPQSPTLRFAAPIGIHGGNILALRVQLHPQVYKGMLVEFTDIRVMMDTIGVLSIAGNHYPEIFIPHPVVFPHEAQQALLGKVLIWFGFGGDPNEFEITQETFCQEDLTSLLRHPHAAALPPGPEIVALPGQIERVVLPHHTGAGIELRVAWRLRVRSSCDGSSPLAWDLFVDTVTGELLLTRQLFFT